MNLIGVDVGGTFTDLVFCDTGSERVAIHKVATTPDDPARGVMTGILELCKAQGVDPASIGYVLHGTTTATNAVLQNIGAKTGMITNEGFRDILHIARHQRVEHYSIRQQLPWQSRPLIERRYRKVVTGRLIPPHGAELIALDEAALRQAAMELKAEGVESVAVCFLFSYLNPDHERRAAAIVREVMPDAFVTTSADVSPQFREFERFTTAALAAFVGPRVRVYVDNLEQALKAAGVAGELRIMASNGGVATASMVAERPALTLLSGLAAGVLGGGWIGELAGRSKLITFDIGGTSADIGIIVDGRIAEADARSTLIAGFPLLMPMIDIHTIGAGGGSIAYIDKGGAFKVGPRSAGALPGPAAYGHGGDEPTVTDANLVLGRLAPQDFLGGGMKLNVEAATRVISRLSDSMGLGLFEAAEGVLTVINANMANAVRSRTIQKGIDPRDFSLVAFGGAGPLHGAEVAAMLDVPEVIVPPYPGITSAMGLLTTDLKYDAARTLFQTSETLDFTRMNADFTAMAGELAARFDADHIPPADITWHRIGDLRYVGQGYELKVKMPLGEIGADEIAGVFADFHRQHSEEYGHAFPESPIEIVNIRVSGIGRMEKLTSLTAPAGGSLAAALVRSASCVFRVEGKLQAFDTAFYRRTLLPVGEAFNGPAIVLQTDSTTVIPPGARATVDPAGNIIIRLDQATGGAA